MSKSKSKKSYKGNKNSDKQRRNYKSNNTVYYHRGDVYYVDLRDGYVGSEQGGLRPCVILQVEESKQGTSLIVACMTTKDKGRPMQFHIEVSSKNKEKDSYVLCEQLMTITEKELITYLYRISEDEMADVSRAINRFLNLHWKTRDNRPEMNKEDDENVKGYRRGQVYNVNLGTTQDVQMQECLIIQNNNANEKSQTLVIACMTEDKKVNYKQIRTVDKTRVSDYLYRMDKEELGDVSRTINSYLELRW
jgi:mRNA interferase MazF